VENVKPGETWFPSKGIATPKTIVKVNEKGGVYSRSWKSCSIPGYLTFEQFSAWVNKFGASKDIGFWEQYCE